MYPNKTLLCDLADRKITRRRSVRYGFLSIRQVVNEPIILEQQPHSEYFCMVMVFFHQVQRTREQMLNQHNIALDGSSSAGLILTRFTPIW